MMPHPSLNTRRLLGLLSLLATVAGCTGNGSGMFRDWRTAPTPNAKLVPDKTNADAQAAANADAGVPAPPAAARNYFRVEVLRIDVPAGSVTQDASIWRLLDEAVLPPRQTGLLQANGFRVALGGEGQRDAFRRLIEAIPTLKVAIDVGVPPVDHPIELQISDVQRDLAVFLRNTDGGMRGRTFDSVRSLWQLTVKRSGFNDDGVHFDLVPELRGPSGPARYQQTAQGIRAVPEYCGQVFRDMSIALSVPRGGFLVIAATPELRESPLLARAFMGVPNAGATRESALVLIPRYDNAEQWWPRGVNVASEAARR